MWNYVSVSCGLTSVYEQVNLSEDVLQSQTLQRLQLQDFWEDVKDWTGYTVFLIQFEKLLRLNLFLSALFFHLSVKQI